MNEMLCLCPALTRDDIVFCFFSKLGLSNSIIGYCLCNINNDPIKQQKYRIKLKMAESQCEALFESIFAKNKPG
jgi:hypothetical protein